MSIEETFRTIADYMGVDAVVTQDADRIRPVASEVRRLRCNGQKLEQASGFRPTVPFATGIGRTVEWFSAPRNLARYKGHLYNV